MQGENLIAGLGGLQRASRPLALREERRHLRAVGVDIPDNTGLHAHRVLQSADGIVPARAGVSDELLVRRGHRHAAVLVLKRLVDLLDVEGDVLRLTQKLLGALDVLLNLLERGIRQAGEIAALVDEHLRLILQAGDLVGDLLQRPRGGQHVLRMVRRIEHADGVG